MVPTPDSTKLVVHVLQLPTSKLRSDPGPVVRVKEAPYRPHHTLVSVMADHAITGKFDTDKDKGAM